MELNFPLFFGLSVMLYEATLISDDSPFDRDQLTAQQKRGKEIFEGKGKCIACHDGPLFSKAAHVATPGKQPSWSSAWLMGDGKPSLYDNGFYNIGVRPTRRIWASAGPTPGGPRCPSPSSGSWAGKPTRSWSIPARSTCRSPVRKPSAAAETTFRQASIFATNVWRSTAPSRRRPCGTSR